MDKLSVKLTLIIYRYVILTINVIYYYY